MLGPVLERLHDELLQPLVARVFRIMARNGLIPPPPKGARQQRPAGRVHLDPRPGAEGGRHRRHRADVAVRRPDRRDQARGARPARRRRHDGRLRRHDRRAGLGAGRPQEGRAGPPSPRPGAGSSRPPSPASSSSPTPPRPRARSMSAAARTPSPQCSAADPQEAPHERPLRDPRLADAGGLRPARHVRRRSASRRGPGQPLHRRQAGRAVHRARRLLPHDRRRCRRRRAWHPRSLERPEAGDARRRRRRRHALRAGAAARRPSRRRRRRHRPPRHGPARRCSRARSSASASA